MSDSAAIRLELPLSAADVLALHAGEPVKLSGLLLTGRDAAHKWMFDTFIDIKSSPSIDDFKAYESIKAVLKNGAIYHCGPVVDQQKDGSYQLVAAGPTTSIREEPYQNCIIHHYGLRVIIGKGGMGANTIKTLQEDQAVYLHATGGAAAVMAACVKEVLGVFMLQFGVPEAMWLIRVEELPLVVSMDAHGNSLHEKIRTQSKRILNGLIGEPEITC